MPHSSDVESYVESNRQATLLPIQQENGSDRPRQSPSRTDENKDYQDEALQVLRSKYALPADWENTAGVVLAEYSYSFFPMICSRGGTDAAVGLSSTLLGGMKRTVVPVQSGGQYKHNTAL